MSTVDKKEVESDIKRLKALDSVKHTEGGKLIINGLEEDTVALIDTLLSTYTEAPEMKLRTTIAKLEANLNILRIHKNSEKNKELAEETLEILKNE